MTRSNSRRRLGRVTLGVATLLFGIGLVGPLAASAYDIHKDRLDCPKGTTLLRIEVNPRTCQAQPKRGIPATKGRRACCSIDRDPTKVRCLPFPGCPAASPA